MRQAEAVGTTALMTTDQLRTELHAAYRAIVALGASIDTLTEERDAARTELAQHAALVAAAREYAEARAEYDAAFAENEDAVGASDRGTDWVAISRRLRAAKNTLTRKQDDVLIAALAVQPAASVARGEGEAK